LALKPTLGLRSFVPDGRQALLLHETIESGLSTGNGIALNYAAIQRGNLKGPSNKEAGLDLNHHVLVSREGRGGNFILTSSFTGRVNCLPRGLINDVSL
jgi:hypothetical protein